VHPLDSQPLVSVVIPAYNAEKTLARTLESVLSQTLSSLQVVVVDDGSRDRTLAIAREFAAEDPRVSAVAIEPAGVSAARNRGIELSEGKYIRFVDADDTLPPDSMEVMVSRAEKDSADLVVGGFTMYVGDISHRRNLEERNDTLSNPEVLRLLCPHSNTFFYGVLWNKLFSRKLIHANDVRFMDGLTWGEDFCFVMDYLRHAETVAYLEESLYDYRRQPGSMTIRQVLDCVVHPFRNIRMKRVLYSHLKDLYVARGEYPRYRHKLWLYLFRVALNQ